MTDCLHCGLILDRGVQRECPMRAPNAAGLPMSCEPEPEAPPMYQETRHRFHVRWVDRRRQRYVFLADLRLYYDACIVADTAVARVAGEDFVVWDADEEMVIYDSRRFR